MLEKSLLAGRCDGGLDLEPYTRLLGLLSAVWFIKRSIVFDGDSDIDRRSDELNLTGWNAEHFYVQAHAMQ
eukprot:m.114243 g.114243  ORF g.114243 m.114243 type:complete len:71 (+) comp15470_c0_seq2:2060-2272(+)